MLCPRSTRVTRVLMPRMPLLLLLPFRPADNHVCFPSAMVVLGHVTSMLRGFGYISGTCSLLREAGYHSEQYYSKLPLEHQRQQALRRSWVGGAMNGVSDVDVTMRLRATNGNGQRIVAELLWLGTDLCKVPMSSWQAGVIDEVAARLPARRHPQQSILCLRASACQHRPSPPDHAWD